LKATRNLREKQRVEGKGRLRIGKIEKKTMFR